VTSSIQRLSLAEQAIRVLREGLVQGRWTESLPGEMELSRELQISRGTLRRALDALAHEEVISKGGRGQRHKILCSSAPIRKAHGNIIRVLVPFGSQHFGELHLIICDSLRERAGREGYRVEFEHHPRLFSLRNPRELARLNALPGTAGWVVLNSTPGVQRWFSVSKIPCVVLGPPFPDTALSCVWPDTCASARHAAGLFCARGHRDVVYLIRSDTTLGDHRGAAAFSEEATRLGLRPQVVTVEAGAVLRRMVDFVLARRPQPTGFMLYGQEDAITLLSHLQDSGRRVPRDVSLIAGWADSIFGYTVPSIAHYRIDGARAGKTIAQLLIKQIELGASGKVDTVLLPEFVPGGSLAERATDDGA
jgi:DNA-binding LacI/PurR family transcriptional regulator